VSSRDICYSTKVLILANKDILWTRPNTVTIFQIMCGNFWSHIFRAGKTPGEGKARDNRQFINTIFWILRTGAPWRDLPPSYGDWKNTHRRFCRWRDKGIWASLLERPMDEPNYEWLMIDASHVKAHSHASGARGGNQGIGLTKRGSTARYTWPWMRMVCRSECLLQRAPEQIVQRQVS
jgi:transposase